MKRVVAIVIIMAVVTSLFAFSANAQGLTYQEYKYDSQQVDGVTANINVTRYYPNNVGTAAAPGASYIPYLVYIQLYNNNNQPALVNSLRANIVFTDNGWVPQVWNIENFTEDLTMSFDGGTVGCRIVPSSSFSYGNGIVVPPKKSLYLIAEVQVRVDWNPSNQNDPYTSPVIDSVSCSNFTVGLGDYNYGDAVDMSGVIAAIDNLTSTVGTSTQLTELINAIKYTGSAYYYTSNSANKSSYEVTYTSDNETLYYYVYRTYGRSYLSSIDTEQNGNTDTTVVNGTICYPVTYFIFCNSSSNSAVPVQLELLNALPYSNCIFHIESMYSDVYKTVSVETNKLRFYHKHPYNSSRGIIPQGVWYTIIYGTIEVPLGTTLSWDNVSINTNFFVNNDVYMPLDEYTILRDLYIAYSSVNGLDDISNSSDDISDKSEQAHIQEQSYFTQNAQAIQQTGLNNYRFNGDQENGIGSVSHDFTLLWNALGGFNSIYVFSLTLSLALMILRHAPGVIRSSRRNKEE